MDERKTTEVLPVRAVHCRWCGWSGRRRRLWTSTEDGRCPRCSSPLSSRPVRGIESSPSQEDAVKLWASTAYALPLDDIEQVSFDVQYANLTDPREPHLQLEIDVRMADGHQHLFTRCVCEFGQIVDEVLDVAR